MYLLQLAASWLPSYLGDVPMQGLSLSSWGDHYDYCTYFKLHTVWMGHRKVTSVTTSKRGFR